MGVYISSAKGNNMVGLVKSYFRNLDKDNGETLYCTLLRPHLEYSAQCWSPYDRKYILELEKVQRRFKLIPKLRKLNYGEQL